MHKIYVPESVDLWLRYYEKTIQDNSSYQLGGYIDGFKGYAKYQRGAGLGNFFKKLLRIAMPFLKSVGKTAAVAGSTVLSDIASGRNSKESFKEHSLQAAGKILHDAADRVTNQAKQSGTGLGRRDKRRRQTVITNKRKKKPRKSSVDINSLSRSVGFRERDIFA